MKKRFFIVLFFCLTTVLTGSAVWAQNVFNNESHFRFGTGVLSLNALTNTTSEDASSDFFGTNYILPLHAQWSTQVFGLGIMPRLLYTLIPVEAADEGSKSTVLLASLPAVFNLNDSLEATVGLGYMLRTIKGEGGTTELGNGTSTSTFALPGRSETTKNFLLEAGIHYTTLPYVLSFELLGSSLLSERRSVSFLITLNYRI